MLSFCSYTTIVTGLAATTRKSTRIELQNKMERKFPFGLYRFPNGSELFCHCHCIFHSVYMLASLFLSPLVLSLHFSTLFISFIFFSLPATCLYPFHIQRKMQDASNMSRSDNSNVLCA